MKRAAVALSPKVRRSFQEKVAITALVVPNFNSYFPEGAGLDAATGRAGGR